jgi:hypothetical protein
VLVEITFARPITDADGVVEAAKAALGERVAVKLIGASA